MNIIIHRHRTTLAGIALVLATTSTSEFALAMIGPPEYDLSWHTIDGGGGTSSGGDYSLTGTIGQPDPGAMSGGTFALVGGFWAAGSDVGIPCPADITGDDQVGPADLGNLLAAWGTNPGGPPDFSGNGNVGPEDLGTLLAGWGQCP
jgi:hypothetical protein